MRTLALVALCALAPGAASAQTLRGRVVDTSTQAPVAGAALQLLTADSAVVVSGRADKDGAFSVSAPRAGEYLVRVQRPGYDTAVLGPLPLRRDEPLDITLALARNAIEADTTVGE